MDERGGPAAPRRSERCATVLRVAEAVAFVALGAALGSLVLLVPASGRSLVVQIMFFGATMAYTAVVLVEQSRQRRQVETQERGSPAPSASLFQRPLARRLLTVFYGTYLAGLCVVGARLAAVALSLGLAAVYVVALVLVRRSRRRQLAAARAAHPGSAVVLVALTGLASMRLAQWAKAVRTTLPASLGGRGVLVAGPDGVALLCLTRTRPLPRWGWDDVELRRGPHPALPDAVVIVLTLLGPVPAERSRAVPLGQRRFDLPLAVRGGTWSAPPSMVDAVLAELLAQRPAAVPPHAAPDGAAPDGATSSGTTSLGPTSHGSTSAGSPRHDGPHRPRVVAP